MRSKGIVRTMYDVRLPAVIVVLALFVVSVAFPSTGSITDNPANRQHILSQHHGNTLESIIETHRPSQEKPGLQVIGILELTSVFSLEVPLHFGLQSFQSAFPPSSFLILTLYTSSQL